MTPMVKSSRDGPRARRDSSAGRPRRPISSTQAAKPTSSSAAVSSAPASPAVPAPAAAGTMTRASTTSRSCTTSQPSASRPAGPPSWPCSASMRVATAVEAMASVRPKTSAAPQPRPKP